MGAGVGVLEGPPDAVAVEDGAVDGPDRDGVARPARPRGHARHRASYRAVFGSPLVHTTNVSTSVSGSRRRASTSTSVTVWSSTIATAVLGRHVMPACTARGRIAAWVSPSHASRTGSGHTTVTSRPRVASSSPTPTPWHVADRVEEHDPLAEPGGVTVQAGERLVVVEHPVLVRARDGHRVVRRAAGLRRVAARRDTTASGARREDAVRRRLDAGAQVDAAPLALADPPVGEVRDLAAAGEPLRQADRAAERACCSSSVTSWPAPRRPRPPRGLRAHRRRPPPAAAPPRGSACRARARPRARRPGSARS